MPLSAGTRVGPYVIEAPLGAGGMGEVYRAHDSKLNRAVAIKVLPDLFAGDPERLARFTREAQTLAALNHPHIAQVYGLEGNALVMELVAGDDLSTIIARGPIPDADALPIARQIAEALEAAHEQGIIHRDLKPANIKIRPDGTVKVLDFGLAKALSPEGAGGSASAANSPTFTLHATQVGVILGTAAYMAPEQVKGKAVDRRADIWAFGVVLHEMLTGRGLFGAETIPETLSHVLTREIDLAALPAGTPPRIRKLIGRCLVKDPKQRLRDIGDARLLLDEADEPAAPVLAARGPAPRSRGLLALSFPLVATVAAAAAWFAKTTAPGPTLRLSIAVPPGEQITTAPAISADGQTIAYAAGRSPLTSRLYVRGINEFAPRAIDSGASATYPFFSPDGKTVAFFAGGKLWRAAVGGGGATTVASAPRGWGGTWAADGSIVYVPGINAGLWRIPAGGGKADQLTKPDDDAKGYAHVFPQAMPGGDVLFTFWGKTFYTAVLSTATGTWREATSGGRSKVGTYTADGHILIGDATSGLRAATWTPATTTPVTPDTVVLDNVHWLPATERAWFAASDNGTAVYAPGDPNQRRLVWVDRQGRVTPITDVDQITHASVSRDGTRIVYNGRGAQWVRDLVTGTRTRFATDINSWNGGWTPGDKRIVLSSSRTGDWDLYTIDATGTGDLVPILKRPKTQHPLTVAPDGSVIFLETGLETGLDLFTLSVDGQVSPLAVTRANETSPSVSADSRYVAYISDESGRYEVYAIPASGTGGRIPVSADGGTGPVWSPAGRELFYRAGDNLVSVEVRSTNPLQLGAHRTLVDVSAFDPMYFHEFDVSPDGQRFLFMRTEPAARPTRLDVIVNWFPELARLVKR